MNETQIKADILEMECRIESLKKSLKENEVSSKESSPDIIRVPNCIHIEMDSGGGDRLGIRFNDDKQVLTSDQGVFEVYRRITVQGHTSYEGDIIPCKLVPVEIESLKRDYTYFRDDTGLLKTINLELLDSYCKYLGENYLCFVNKVNEVRVSRDMDFTWYEVVPIEEGDDE